MFPKLAAVVILTILIAAFEPTRVYAIPFFVLASAVVFVIEGVRVVPQQNAWVVERLGRFHSVLEPGLNIIVPFFDRVAYRHSLKEVPLDVPEQVCITKDNTQLSVDGILYFQVTDPRLASYGTSDYITAITQLAQTTLRSEVGKMELDKTFESRDEINKQIVAVLDEAGRSWGVKVLRYEIRNINPPHDVLQAMEKQMRAEREKRAVVLTSEGERDAKINQAEGEKQRVIKQSEASRQQQINVAEGQAEAILAVAKATAEGLRRVAEAVSTTGGREAMQLRVAEDYIEQFGNLARTGNTLVVPANLSDIAGMIALATKVFGQTHGDGGPGQAPPPPPSPRPMPTPGAGVAR